MSPKDYIRKLLVSTSVICTVISICFYFVYAAVNEVESLLDNTGIAFRQFLLILLFSLLVAAVNGLLSFQGMRPVFRVLIHYATLLAAFLVVFLWAGNLKISGAASFFLAIMIFTVLYAVFFLAAYFLLRLLGALPTQKKAKTEEKPVYRSRFK